MMNENKTFIGVYHSETELLAKMDELKTNGYSEEDMYVTAKNDDAISTVRGRTNAEVERAEGSWGDRFMSFLTGIDPVRDGFRRMGFTEEESDRYYNDVENGAFLLYVDRDYYENHYDEGYDPSRTVGLAHGNRSELDGEQLDPIQFDALDKTNPSQRNAMTDPNLGGNLHVDHDRDERLTSRTANHADDVTEAEKIRLHEERLNVQKDRVQTGEVHVEKDVVEEEQVIDVPVEREEVFVERRTVSDVDDNAMHTDDTSLRDRDRAFTDDDETIRVPVTEERVEVTKKPVVSEEVVIGKRKVQDTETVRETVRREEAHVEEEHDGLSGKRRHDDRLL